MVEHVTFNHVVAGSTPARLTTIQSLPAAGPLRQRKAQAAFSDALRSKISAWLIGTGAVAVIGGWLFGAYFIGVGGIPGAILGATAGAVILLFALRIIRRAV